MLTLTVLGTVMMCGASAGELWVLDPAQGDTPPNLMMHAYLKEKLHEALAKRRETYEQLEMQDQIAAYQERMHAYMVEQLGGWPERTPLNARTVGAIQGDGFRIEKVIYESRPKFYVTATLFLPESEPPYPGVLIPCGHTRNGKVGYQNVGVSLARNGMAALCYDPIDQGERIQVLKADGTEAYWGTRAHTMAGVGSILVGRNLASYRIWDGIRGLDYLAERPEVDAERLGCTGNSGGGTLTSYIMALDDRVQCAAPSCFLTSYDRLIDTIGPDDAEQQIFGQVGFGMDESDYVLMRAPKPTLMCVATQDFFDITGSWDTFREAKRLYTRMGFSERMDIAEADEKHGFSLHLRTAAVRWMRRWLLGVDDAIVEAPHEFYPDEELWCVPDGLVYRLPDAKTVYELNGELADALAADRKRFWESTPRDEALAKVRELAWIRPLADIPEPEVTETGKMEHLDVAVRKLTLSPEEGVLLPALLFEPGNADGDAYLVVHGEGKQAAAESGGPIAALLKKGHNVLAVDLRGLGETARLKGDKGWDAHFGKDWKQYYQAYLLGRSFVGMRAEDILLSARYLAAQPGVERVHLVATDCAGPPALHAAAAEPDVFESVRIEGGVSSWADVARAPETQNQLINTVHGALRFYDLPDLQGSLGAAKLTVNDPRDPMGNPLK